MNYWFFKTVKDEKGVVRVRLLANQKLVSGSSAKDLNVSCSKEIRLSLPLGTIFVSSLLKGTEKSRYYTAGGDFRAIDFENDNERAAYETYLGRPLTDKELESVKISYISKLRRDPKYNIPVPKLDGFWVDDRDWYLLMRNIEQKINTMIIGPTGSGKTQLIYLACQKLGIPLKVYDMGSMMDPISGLLGVHRLEKGESIFDYAKFTQDIQEPCVILLDELSRAAVTSNNILFPCLDDRRELPVEIAGGKDIRNIKVHPGVCFIATANIGAEYTGTMSMDRALVNRFFPLELDYIPEDQEIEVLVKRTGVSLDNAKSICKITNNIRSLYKKQEVSVSLSTRETLMVSKLVVDGWALGEAMEMIYLPIFEGSRSDGERGTVRKTILSY